MSAVSVFEKEQSSTKGFRWFLLAYSVVAAFLLPLWFGGDGNFADYIRVVGLFFVFALISPPIWILAFLSGYAVRAMQEDDA